MQTLKLSAETINVLKNFANINGSIVFKPGNTIATIAPTKNIMAKAAVAENFESQFAIYDLARFLSVLSLFNDPELNIGDKIVTIKSDKKKLNYTFADPSMVLAPPDKSIKLPTVDVSLTLPQASLADVLKGLSVLRLPELAFVGDGKSVFLQAIDSKNPSGDVYSVDLGETDSVFKMIFKAENIKILPGDYTVELSSKGIARFFNEKIEYFIALESNSTFEG